MLFPMLLLSLADSLLQPLQPYVVGVNMHHGWSEMQAAVVSL